MELMLHWKWLTRVKNYSVIFSMSLGLNNVDPDTYHCTVMFSRAPVPAADDLKRDIEAVGFATGYEVFPTKDGSKCLVLRLQCDEAEKLNHVLTKLGATSDYPTYKAHVTICEQYTGSEAVEELPKPQFPLYFRGLTVAALIE